jgi:hypothetical protein
MWFWLAVFPRIAIIDRKRVTLGGDGTDPIYRRDYLLTKRDREGFLEWRERLVCSACGGRDSRDGGDRETTPGRLGKELPTYDLPAGRAFDNN